jgi:hypothetical protein
MCQHTALSALLFCFLLATSGPGHSQDPQTLQSAKEPATSTAAEPGLTLAAAGRVYLTAELGTTVQAGSGRGSPSAELAREGLEKAITKWGRFALVDSPEKADLILVIVEGSRNSGVRVGVLTERLLVSRAGTDRTTLVWKSNSYDGGIRDYRPVAKAVDEFRAAVEEYDKTIPKELLAQAQSARKRDGPSSGCATAQSDFTDCIAQGNSRLYLPDDREENRGAVKLAEVVLHMSLLDTGKYVSITEFSNYIVSIQKLLNHQFTEAQRQPGKDIAVDGTLQPDGKTDLRLASRPEVDQRQMQSFYDALLHVPRPAVHDGPVEFRVVFQLWGGSEQSHTER